MIKESCASGFYESLGTNKQYPRLQIVTIEELLNGKQIQYPRLESITFRKAEKQKKEDSSQQLEIAESVK